MQASWQEVRQEYRQDTLARILTLPEADFGSAFGMETTEVSPRQSLFYPEDAGHSIYHYRDNGSPVLAVAHLDTVVQPEDREPRFHGPLDDTGPIVISGALDDRLGAYVILELLPALGVTCDWLLTTGEERCQSTASSFTPSRKYNHVIEFDRAGTDVVSYQYDSESLRRLVHASGIAMDHGSYSDIAELEHLGVKCLNWGVGYGGNYHSPHGYAYLNDTFEMVARYLQFHAQNAKTPLPHNPQPSYFDSPYPTPAGKRSRHHKVRKFIAGRRRH